MKRLETIAKVVLTIVLISFSTLSGAYGQEPKPVATAPQTSASSRQIASEAMKDSRDERWRNADSQLFVAAIPALEPDTKIRLIVNSRFSEIIPIEVTVSSPEGNVLALRSDELEPRRTVDLNLLEHLTDFAARSQPSSVRVSFFGDAEMTQAWLLISGPSGVTEVPLVARSKHANWQWSSFWDARPYGKILRRPRPTFLFHNADLTPVEISGEVTDTKGKTWAFLRAIPPSGTISLRVPATKGASAGQLRVQHDGLPGQVVAAAYLASPGFLASLPVAKPAQLVEAKIYESPGLPLGPDARAEAIVSLFNAERQDGEPILVAVSLLDLVTGREVAVIEQPLASGEIRSINLRETMSEAFEEADRPLRVQIRRQGDSPFLTYGMTLSSKDGPTDLALIPRFKVHDSGTYPIPGLDDHEVTTTLVNLGEEPAQVFAHLSWERGEYALDPIEILPGGAFRVDFRDLVIRGKLDLKKRAFRPGNAPTYFQWLSRRGSSSLIARTEIRPINGDDVYGFNCFGCCMEFPFGGLEPQFAAFRVGDSADFEPVEFIDTCSGTIGPFHAVPTSTTYSSPLGWNNYDIWATGQTQQTVSFTSQGTYSTITCSTVNRNFFGNGPVVADDDCQEEHNPDFDPSRGCCGMNGSNTTDCQECCDREKEVADCRCDELPFGSAVCKARVMQVIQTNCRNPCAAGCGG